MPTPNERVAKWLGTRPAAHDIRAAVREVLWVLQNELAAFDREVWGSQVSDGSFTAMKERRARLLEDIQIVDAILARYEMRPVAEKPPHPQPNKANPGTHGYGEI